tara:strand:+ start:183 stop:776 length:594 start_codon:yes stop_codon:yes gene_type:complete
MKILNLYSGIGGNRALWGDKHNITAIEYKKNIAEEYSNKFPRDTVIVADAHEYLLEHYKEFDFIWSSPPCPTHSRTNYFTQHIRKKPVYIDIGLYQEIIFLDNFFKGKYVVENVVPFYKPLVKAQRIGRHLFWANFSIKKIKQPKDDIGTMIKGHTNRANKKPLKIRNAVNEELGLHILQEAIKSINNNNIKQTELF